jgi:hypothetical protein
MSSCPSGFRRPALIYAALAAFCFAAVWFPTILQRQVVSWTPFAGVYGEELSAGHRFHWLESPAEIVVWTRSPTVVSIRGEWRCSFHTAETQLETTVNGEPVGHSALTQAMSPIEWAGIHLQTGRNVIRFASSAGGARISAQDARVAAVGVQDLRIRGQGSGPDGRLGIFFLGIAALGTIGCCSSSLAGLQGVDALGGGMLAAFGALSLSAIALSSAHFLNGMTWTSTLVVIAVALWLVRRPVMENAPNPAGFSATRVGILLLPVFFVGVIQMLSPVSKYDDLMYHGARAGYWLENHSVFPYLTHNERQEVFPFPGDLLFAFGVFTARNEAAGRLVVFLAYPAILLLVAGWFRKQGMPAGRATVATWIVAAAPLISDQAIGIKPDLWGALFSLIAANAAWNLGRDPGSADRRLQDVILLGAICAAVSVKFTFFLLLPIGLIPFIATRTWKERGWMVVIAFGWLALFGLPGTLLHNKVREGGWLGSPEMTAVHRPEPGAGPIICQLARLPFVIWELPWVPGNALRLQVSHALNAAAGKMNALTILPLEKPEGWPGRFRPDVPEFGHNYSLLWLFVAMGTIAGVINFGKLKSERPAVMSFSAVGLGVGFLVGVTCAVRWQSNAGIPERFLVTGLILATVGALWLWYRTVGHRRLGRAIPVALLAWHAAPFAHQQWLQLLELRQTGWTGSEPVSVLSPAAAVIPPGARVLLFASQSSGDYVLFHPAEGYPTRVFSWGRRPFSEKALATTLVEANPDFVVFEQAGSLGFHWHEPLALAPFIRYLDLSSSFRRESGGEPNLIYRRNGN